MGATSSHTSNESHEIELSGKIMVAAIIFLFIVVLFVILLHLYAKWFWWRIEEETTAPPPRRRRRRSRFVFAPGQDSVSRDSSQQIGLDPSVLRSLPVSVFQTEDFKDGLECTVCLSEIVEGEKTRLLPKCNHGFHVDCIDMWFQTHSTCPLCRNLVASESSKPISTSNGEEGFSGNSESLEAENLAAMSGSESIDFPTNVLVWGNQTLTQVNSVFAFTEEGTSEQPPTSPSGSDDSGGNSGCNAMCVIDMPSEFSSSSLSPSPESRCLEDEMKSPMSAKLKSLKRLLSRDKKSSSCSHGSMDVEQA